jgi:hypothetical protein
MQNSYTRLIVRRPSLQNAGAKRSLKGSGLRVRQRRCRYRLGKTRADSAFNLGIFAVRRSSRSCDIGSASMRLTASASRQGVAVDLMPADRPLLRRPTPTSQFFDRLNAERKPRQNSNSFSTTSAICSISTIRSYIRVWTLDYWRGSARRPIATGLDLWTSPVRIGRRLQPGPDPGINCAAGRGSARSG